MSITEYIEYFEETSLKKEIKYDEYFEEDIKDGNLIKLVHEKVRYSCNICVQQFSAKGDLKRHIEAVHEKVKYPCDQCEYKFTTNGSLKTHIKSRMVSVLTSINFFILFDKFRTSESVTTLLSSTRTSTQVLSIRRFFSSVLVCSIQY